MVLKGDFSFEETIVEKGQDTQFASGTWNLDGNKVWLDGFLWFIGKKWTRENTYYYWELRNAKTGSRPFAMFGEVSPDRDGYVELTRKP